MASARGRGESKGTGRFLIADSQGDWIGEYRLGDELPQQPGFNSPEPDRLFEMTGSGAGTARAGETFHQVFG